MIKLSSIGGTATPIGTEKWFHTSAGNPLHTADGATYLRAGNILVEEASEYPEVFQNFKHPEGTVWVTQAPITSLALGFVKFLNNRWFAGTTEGTLFTSENGVDWITVGKPYGTSSISLSDMAYGNGKYVLVCATARTQLAISSDGLNWGLSLAFSSTSGMSIVFNGSSFVVAAASGRCMHSTDGYTWSVHSSTALSTSYSFIDIASDGDISLAVSVSYANVYISSRNPAITWVAVAAGPQVNYSIAFGGGYWVVGKASGYFAVSTNGSVWDSGEAYKLPVTETIKAVSWVGKYFLLITTTGKMYNLVMDGAGAPVITGPYIAAATPVRGAAHGTGLTLVIGSAANANTFATYANSVGIPNNYTLAGGEVVKYMRIK